MNKFNTMLKALLFASAFATSALAQDTAYVPFKVNVNATVKAQQGTKTVLKDVIANTLDTLHIILAGQVNVLSSSSTGNSSSSGGDNSPIRLVKSPGRTPNPVTMHSSRGKLSLELSPQYYKNAEISLYSLNGKRVLHDKVNASDAVKNISHQNIVTGVYVLHVKGSGNTFAARLSHQGGGMNIDVAFGGVSPLKKEFIAAAEEGVDFGTWNITVSSATHFDSAYTLNTLTKGKVNPTQNINLRNPRLAASEAMSGKAALKYFTDNSIKAGWNLGNTLDAVSVPAKAAETAWGNPLATQALFNGVKESGFDIVRIPCTWIGHIGPAPDYTVDEARLKRVAEVVNYAKTAGFKAMIINIHHDGNNTQGNNTTWGFVDMPAAVKNSTRKTEIQNQISKVWTQIANYFKNYGDYLIFETLNEVHNGNWGVNAPNNEQDILFDWNQAALSAIRATGGNNATRFVAVPGLGSTEPDIVVAANNRSKLLPNDGNSNGTNKLIVSVHYYAPAQYTVAGVTDQAFQLIHTWGTQTEINSLNHEMELLKTNFIDNGIAVYAGEWGAPTQTRSSMSQTIKDTHLKYIHSVAAAARANGVIPIYWDDGGSSNFKVLERSNGKPKTGLWKDVLDTMMAAIKSASTPNPLIPKPITGNLGNYHFGFKEDGITTNYEQAVWELTSTNLTAAKAAGAKLVLVLTSTPSASMDFAWQNVTTEEWWQAKAILSITGVAQNGASWNASTKTLTIDLATALKDYDDFANATNVNFIIAYYGFDNINNLGIVSANIE